MRLSRPRVLLRAVLLLVGAAFMWWRSALSWRAGRELPGDAGLLQGRLSLVFALMGLLALLTGLVALGSLRKKPRLPTLRLGARPPGADQGSGANPPAGAGLSPPGGSP